MREIRIIVRPEPVPGHIFGHHPDVPEPWFDLERTTPVLVFTDPDAKGGIPAWTICTADADWHFILGGVDDVESVTAEARSWLDRVEGGADDTQ